MKKYWKFIGLDLGAESSRCMVGEFNDLRIKLTEVHRFKTHCFKSENDEFHWDIESIFADIVNGLSKAQKEFGSDFDGIAVDSWGVDYALTDNKGKVLRNPFHYRDNRTDNIMEDAFKINNKEALYKKSGVCPAQYNTIFQLLAEKYRDPNLLYSAYKMLLIPDFINFMLSGIKKSEYSISSTTGLSDPYLREWSWQLIDEFGIPKNIFPEMVQSGAKLGTLLPAVAGKTKLNNDIPIFTCACHDTASAAVSIPAFNEPWAFISSGTWSLIGIETAKPIITDQSLKYGFTNEGGAGISNLFLKNIAGLWPIQECKRYWCENNYDYSYKEISESISEEGYAKEWVDLNDPRFMKPGSMPEKIKSYLKETKQNIKNNTGFIIGVVLESLAFSYRKTIQELEDTTGQKIDILYAVGGGIQNELLMQYTSDALGLNIISGPVEGTAAGNIGIQAISAGAVSDLKAWRNIVANSFELKIYNPKNTDYFNQNEKNYDKILLKNIYKLDRNNIVEKEHSASKK